MCRRPEPFLGKSACVGHAGPVTTLPGKTGWSLQVFPLSKAAPEFKALLNSEPVPSLPSAFPPTETPTGGSPGILLNFHRDQVSLTLIVKPRGRGTWEDLPFGSLGLRHTLRIHSRTAVHRQQEPPCCWSENQRWLWRRCIREAPTGWGVSESAHFLPMVKRENSPLKRGSQPESL
jgi:hypothetical protein